MSIFSCSRVDNECPTKEPPAITAVKHPSPSRIATTIRVSSAPSTSGWRVVVAITLSRRTLFWLSSLRNFNFQPDLYGSMSIESPFLGMASTFSLLNRGCTSVTVMAPKSWFRANVHSPGTGFALMVIAFCLLMQTIPAAICLLSPRSGWHPPLSLERMNYCSGGWWSWAKINKQSSIAWTKSLKLPSAMGMKSSLRISSVRSLLSKVGKIHHLLQIISPKKNAPEKDLGVCLELTSALRGIVLLNVE